MYGNVTLIDSLLDNCNFCAQHIRKKNQFYTIDCTVNVLVPEIELEFWKSFLRTREVTVLGGSRDNVLARYGLLAENDYIVRLTSDCPNVPPMAINKAVFTAVHHEMDYLSNAWESYRTSIDGHDVEIISKRAMEWLAKHALPGYDQEHVTPAIRKQKHDLKCGVLINKEDISGIKLCIDTVDEYNAAVKRFESSHSKKNEAMKKGLFVYEY